MGNAPAHHVPDHVVVGVSGHDAAGKLHATARSGPLDATLTRRPCPRFLDGGGRMGALTRAHDWSEEPLGPPDGWPQSLKTTVRLVLSSGHPMLVWWGPQLIQFYNDAHSSSLGPDQQLGALGQPGRTCPPEVWREIGPRIDQLMAGRGSTWHERHPVPVIRGGRRGDTGSTCSFSPIDEPDAPNGVGGVLMIRQERTAAPLAGRLAAERHQGPFEHAPGFITILRGPELTFEFVNRAFSRLFGSRGFIGRTVREAFPDLGNQGFHERLDAVYASGERFLAHTVPRSSCRPPPVRPPGDASSTSSANP